ncbi:hypothetical protein PISMIDRAFT_299636 [Pisolithus microcarpus 441]|uniref:Ubiquitin-like domain-containing protein n=1 Tax=Pisolithus microcarpus 441 TaxID=765257 RepID=A0A0C9ZX03_9AGAM|nr:hypothetical protein PISMIDRAFT_299636 [Pisolithus microcarpus 441]
MSLVAIRIELPAYSQSFVVEIPPGSTILDVKQAIFTSCAGHPRPEGQRIIWRGRYLNDAERIDELWPLSDEQRTVHLSVQPSAWTTAPILTSSSSSWSSASTIPNIDRHIALPKRNETSPPLLADDEDFAFVRYKHWQALYVLSNRKLAPPMVLSDPPTRRNAAKSALERRGWAWPVILDSDIPYNADTNQDCVAYEVVIIHGKPYLSLREPRGTPNDLQLRALKVLTYTFSIMSLPLATPPLPTPTAPHTQSLPPEIHELLQHLRLPALTTVPNVNADVTAHAGIAPTGVAAAEHAEANLMREVPMRALLAPLLMVALRTVLLLYFFSPTRKPLLGLCIIAWIIYEMWTHIRIVILQPLNRGDGNAAPADRARRNVFAPGPPPPPPLNGQDNGNVPTGSRTPDANRARPDGERSAQGPPTPSQPNGLIDSLALMDIHNENKLLWPTQLTRVADPPTFTQKAIMFLSLGVATLHPEVYNRRRAILRQREGRLRTEMNVMERTSESTGNVEPNEDELRRQQYREQLQIQHSRRPSWVKDYVIRVRAGDWLDE